METFYGILTAGQSQLSSWQGSGGVSFLCRVGNWSFCVLVERAREPLALDTLGPNSRVGVGRSVTVGTCSICGRFGNGLRSFPQVLRLAGIKGLTLAAPYITGPKPDDTLPNDTAHEQCYRALEKIAAQKPDIRQYPETPYRP